MAEDAEPDKRADASGSVDEKNKEALENDGLVVNLQDGPVAAGERSHLFYTRSCRLHISRASESPMDCNALVRSVHLHIPGSSDPSV